MFKKTGGDFWIPAGEEDQERSFESRRSGFRQDGKNYGRRFQKSYFKELL